MKQILSIFLVLAMSASINHALAQNEDAPFDYPVPPDTCVSLESRCNYIIANFWNNYNIARPITNDEAFRTAFVDYVSIMKHSHRNIALTSIRNFIFKARANAGNLLKVGKVAEDALYGPSAEYWSDELYMEVARAMSESTTLKADTRNYYKQQLKTIGACIEGNEIPAFNLVLASGKKGKLSDFDAPAFLVFFTDGSSSSTIDRTRLSTDVTINELIASHRLKVVQVYVGKPESNWIDSQPENWTNTYSEQVDKTIDLRVVPSCFTLDGNRIIVQKNMPVEYVKAGGFKLTNE